MKPRIALHTLLQSGQTGCETASEGHLPVWDDSGTGMFQFSVLCKRVLPHSDIHPDIKNITPSFYNFMELLQFGNLFGHFHFDSL